MKNILAAILLLTLFACQSTQNQIEDGYRLTQDEFKDFKRYSMPSAGELDGAPMLSLSQAFIEVFTDVKKESVGTTLAVILHYEGWVFINPGESLVFPRRIACAPFEGALDVVDVVLVKLATSCELPLIFKK